MPQIQQINAWRTSTSTGAAYERLLATLGSDKFGPTVRDSVLSLTAGARRIYLFEATGREESSLLYYSGEPHLAELFPAYLKWYLARDPLCDAYCAAPHRSDVATLRVRPEDIDSTGFRRRIFEDSGIVERLSVIQRGPNAWRVINVARHESDGCFSDEEVASLVGLACLVLPMLPLIRHSQALAQPVSIARLEERFAARCAALTERERQVCARAALGMSVDATAEELCIGRTSVLTYRQRAYQRLNVASPLQLRALVTN
jgi:DNA-binding CsgD family transcriptional regulator